jgi:hypothetical protein
MEVDRQLKLMALDMACQRLAKRVGSLARAGVPVHPNRLEDVDGLVARAIAALEKGAASTTEGLAQKPPSESLLKKMLKGRDVADEAPPTLSRSQDTPPSPRHTLALRGHGACVPISELLGFLGAQQKTGLLEVVTPAEVYAVELQGGDIVHVDVSRMPPGHRLGDVLVVQGAINREMLEVMRKMYASERLGEVLLRQRLVTREQLYWALQTQIQLLFNRLFVAPMTRFSFWAGPPIAENRGIRMSAMTLILEGSRVLDGKAGLKAKRTAG